MDKDYLIEEVIGSLDELKPFSDAFVIQSVNDDDYGMIKLLKEAEMIVEHLASCIVALKKAI
jgi:hypothetical protein